MVTPISNTPPIEAIEIHSKNQKVTSCDGCYASCCRLEVMLISDTGVPEKFIKVDQWGSLTMNRLDDGWCAALDRDTMLCSIYEQRPQICRDLKMGEYECLAERLANKV